MKPAATKFRVLFFLLAGGALVALSFALDAGVQSWMEAHQTPGANAFMRSVSRWGDWPPHVVLGLILGALSYFLGQRQWAVIFAAMILACALAGAINPVIKISAGRSRPSVKEHVGWNGPSFGQKYHSFPSGHTVASTAFFSALFLARRKLGAPFLFIPALIAFSRVYLNAHHFSDVVFAALLGFCCALLSWRIIGRIAPNESKLA